MTTHDDVSSRWAKLPISLRAIVSGIVIALVPANVWPLLLLNLGVPLAAIIEVIFLGLYLWWASGGGPPRTVQATRVTAFRRGTLSPTQWFWGLIGALFFAVQDEMSGRAAFLAALAAVGAMIAASALLFALGARARR